jgi:hypothetical protein
MRKGKGMGKHRNYKLKALVCQNCGTDFFGKRGHAKFCSMRCNAQSWKKSRKKIREEKACVHCGELFVPRSALQIACSIYCRQHNNYSNNRETLLEAEKQRKARDPEKYSARQKIRYREKNVRQYLDEHRRQQRVNKPWRQPIDSAKQRAKQKKLEYNLTAEWAKRIWTGTCAISGLPFGTTFDGRPGPRMYAPSIDRIDPSKGYIQSNCRFILMAVNSLKHTVTDLDMAYIAAAILTNNGFTISRKDSSPCRDERTAISSKLSDRTSPCSTSPHCNSEVR